MEELESLQLLQNGLLSIPSIITEVQDNDILELATVFFNKTWLGQILYPFLRAWFNYERAWQRDIFLQKGLVNTN